MNKLLKGTQTEKHLLMSFAGESQARMRYEFFSKAAQKEGYEQIAAFFQEIALQEKEHAKRFFKFLEGGHVEITGTFPAGVIGTTAANLQAAAEGEHEEWNDLYPKFGKVAQEEGFAEIAEAYKRIALVEAEHEKIFRKFLQNMIDNKVFEKDEVVVWQCRNCGYVYIGKKALEKCPACLHPQSYMEIKKTNF